MKKFAWIFSFFMFGSAFAADQESPLAVDGAVTINVAKAKELFDQGVPFVDVRSDKDWDAGRVPGAEHLELKSQFSQESLGGFAGPSDPVIFYCNGSKCLRSAQAAEQAVKWGYQHVYYFRDGFPAWQTAGYPIE